MGNAGRKKTSWASSSNVFLQVLPTLSSSGWYTSSYRSTRLGSTECVWGDQTSLKGINIVFQLWGSCPDGLTCTSKRRNILAIQSWIVLHTTMLFHFSLSVANGFAHLDAKPFLNIWGWCHCCYKMSLRLKLVESPHMLTTTQNRDCPSKGWNRTFGLEVLWHKPHASLLNIFRVC